MYPREIEIKDTGKRNTSVFYLDLLLSIERDGAVCHRHKYIELSFKFVCLLIIAFCHSRRYSNHIRDGT